MLYSINSIFKYSVYTNTMCTMLLTYMLCIVDTVLYMHTLIIKYTMYAHYYIWCA